MVLHAQPALYTLDGLRGLSLIASAHTGGVDESDPSPTTTT